MWFECEITLIIKQTISVKWISELYFQSRHHEEHSIIALSVSKFFIWRNYNNCYFCYQRKSEITNVNYTYDCLAVYVKHNKTKNDFVFNMTFDVKAPLSIVKVIKLYSSWVKDNNNNIYFQVNPSFLVKKHAGDVNYEQEIAKSSVNLCELQNILKTRIVVRLLLETFADGLGEKFTCPVKKVWIMKQW